eukprot:288746-Chlamydomonas_euryale.AAC.1
MLLFSSPKHPNRVHYLFKNPYKDKTESLEAGGVCTTLPDATSMISSFVRHSNALSCKQAYSSNTHASNAKRECKTKGDRTDRTDRTIPYTVPDGRSKGGEYALYCTTLPAPHATYSHAYMTQLGTQLAMSMMQAMVPMLRQQQPPKPTMRPYSGGGGLHAFSGLCAFLSFPHLAVVEV